MAESQFIPGGSSTSIADSAMSGLGTGLSLMDRVQSMRIRDQQAQIEQQQADMRKKQFDIMLPAIAAKANADVAEAKSTVTGFEQTEQARAAAAEIIPQARSEFDSMMLLADPDAREQAGLEWIGKYGQLANVGSYAKEFSAKKDVIANIHQEATALRHLQAQTDAQKELAQVRADTAIKVADIRSTGADKIGRYRAALDQARADGDQESIDLYTNLLQKAQASPINTAYGSAQMQAKLDAARAAGDPEEIQFWEKRIKALTERGVRKDPAALIDGIVKGLNAGAAPAATTPVTPAKPASAAAPIVPPKIKF